MSGGKRGRRGAGGAGKRNNNSSFRTPAVQRSSAAPGGRLSLGSGAAAPRNRSVGPTPSAPSNAAEETFSLVSGNPLHFAMIIRLAPDLVEEIKRTEAHGGTPRIKFGANANNSAGNVINVGGKDFRFTWSQDRGDLCDIYEERQSEEDGNSLLVESGSAWRKVNVQRVLDESTKNHVKMLSEEAERKSKSRKTIILDPRNPSTKSQVKARATVEGNPSKMTLQQPPHKKRKVEPPPVQIMPHAARDPPNKVISSGTQGIPGGKKSTSSKPSDLQCMLITFLMDNQSNGMTLKALEKAVGGAFPNSARKIKPILKKVATFQAPGRYFLKPGVKIENFMKSTIGSGSSREVNHPTLPTHNKHELPVPKSSLSMRADTNALEGQQQLNSKRDEAPTFLEKVDLVQLSPEYFDEQKAPDHSERPAGRFSDSSTDSESDSSGSGNKSRSRSPVGDGASRSTSDSESDIPSNSEEASDDDLDIMTRDDDRLVKYKPDGTKRQKAGNMNQQKISGSINQVVAKNSNKVGVNSKNQHNVTERSLEAYGDNHGKVSTGEAERHDTEQGVCLPVTKECKMQEINLVTDLNDRQKDTSLLRSNDGCQERRHSSPDEISCSFSKYEKEDPEFRVPINGFSQYKEYVEEYHEKYEKYCLLKKTLESYRFEFFELGKDLDICKGKDMERYYEILARLKDSYCQYGPGHKRLKKIFIVLHKELKHLKQMINDFAASYCKDR
ncbi:PREDICTED: uncharacterized protein LOC109187894 isoform X2 [Ipomoea nil]|uniref:uncharacterized protein LOC109187894 isoform X2 n=1 Tax=Ipomoea nil TaxID=35883 RepID=UPI0009016129|nr:PREDICTED: uncharacterized protein LOC109187894 isoform X2 [Ipomoea nil]